MKKGRNIWDQFREAESAWDEMPSQEAWKSLEQKLGTPAGQAGNPRWPFVLVTVAVLLLAGWGLWKWAAPGAVTPEQLALNPQPAPTVRLPKDPQDLAEARTDRVTAPPPATAAPMPPTAPGSGIQTPSPSEQALSTPVSEEPVLEDVLPISGNGAAFSYNTTLIPPGKMVVTNEWGTPIDTISQVQPYVQRRAGKTWEDNSPALLQLNALRNDISYTSRGTTPFYSPSLDQIDRFNWLLGSWKNQGPSGEAREEWTQVDEFTIQGRGYLVINGDTIITETMRIEQRDKDIYYIVAIDTHRVPLIFRLKSYQPGEWVFENQSRRNRQDLIMRQDDTGQLSTTLRPRDSTAIPSGNPPDPPPEWRNARVQDNSLIRNMSREASPQEKRP